MNVPFSVPRPNMDFLRLGRSAGRGAQGAGEEENQPLSPQQPQRPARDDGDTPEMTERSPGSRFLPRFRPTIPSMFSISSVRRHPNAVPPPQLRPSSSHYSDDEVETPKSPEFTIQTPRLPSTRLHLPNLTRTWTQGSNGPPSRPGTAHSHVQRPSVSRSAETRGDIVTEPVPIVPADHGHTRSRGQGHGRTESRQRLDVADPEALHLADMADDGRRRRHHHRHQSHRREGSDRSRRSNDGGAAVREVEDPEDQRRRRERREQRRKRNNHHHHRRNTRRGPPPKHFLFCFPWIKSRRVRSQILRCFVSGMLLTLLLTVYLALSITKNINNSEFTVLLILIILFVTIFFCHGLIRLCLLIVRPKPEDRDDARDTADMMERGNMPQMFGPGGYAIPRRPIRVVLARDEEAAGIESETTKMKPPAYGLWRESVRVDPNRIYWQRNEESAAEDGAASSSSSSASPSSSAMASGGNGSGSPRSAVPRPPSYASDDGVSYVVEAAPRSIAPTADVPLRPHPSEAGRAGRPSVR